MKRTLCSLIIIILISLVSITNTSFAGSRASIVSSGTYSPNIVWTLDSNGVLKITGTGSIGKFSNDFPHENVKRIIIENGPTHIGEEVFMDYTSLTTIDIPDSITFIGESAFENCYALNSITLPDGITVLKNSIFEDCRNLSSIIIPDSVTTIEWSAFSGCTSLEYVKIPDSVRYIQFEAFKDCTSLTSVDLPQNLITIDALTFVNCSNLTSITVPDSVLYIWWGAFTNCTSLTSINIPDSVISMETEVFAGCSSLESFTVPSKVTVLKSDIFAGCVNLTSITIHDNVTSIADNAFSACNDLIIYGNVNSKAYKYAKEHDISFHCLNHTLKSVSAKEPTCENPGWYQYDKCIYCTYSTYKDNIRKAKDHNLKFFAAKEPTCTKIGWYPYEKCTNCDYSTYEINVRSKKEHNLRVFAAKEPTCIKSGWNSYEKCTVCNYSTFNNNVRKPKGHIKVPDTAVKATRKHSGKTAGSHCSVCHQILKAQKIIPKITYISINRTNFVYNGKAQKPAFTVKNKAGTELIQGTDYTVKVKNAAGNIVSYPKTVGKYKITITFRGNYAGSSTKSFTIKPKSTSIKKLTNSGKGQITVKWSKRSKQLTGYQLAYCPNKKFDGSVKKIRINKSSTTSKTIKKLSSKRTYWVKIRTYKMVNRTPIYSSWSKPKKIVTKSR